MARLVLKPKEDITAFELAHIVAAAGDGRGLEFVERYLSDNCPSALRHLPQMPQKEVDIVSPPN